MNSNGGPLSFNAVINDAAFNGKINSINKQITSVGDNATKQGKKIDDAFAEAEESINKAFNEPIDFVKKRINETGNTAQENGGKIDKAFAAAGTAIAAAFTVDKIISFGKEIFSITAEFEKLEAVLGNTFGSKILAASAMKQLQDFAASTPFQVNELTAAFVKLANQGFVPTGKQMVSLGDLASSTGKSFDQLAEAILDAQTGEYERLKEFGIKAQDAGDKVAFSFKGVKTEVDKSSTAIMNYIVSLGDAEGVANSMAKISQTLTGQVSNLADKWDLLLTTIGNGNKGIMNTAISKLAEMLDYITQIQRLNNVENKYGLTDNNSLSLNNVGRQKSEIVVGLQDRLQKENAEVIKGAKNVSDYVKAWQTLDKERNNMLSRAKGEGYTWAFTKALNEAYASAQNELKANADKLVKDRLKSADQGFGKAKKQGKTDAEKQAEAVQKAYETLSNTFDKLGLNKKLSLEDLNEAKIKAYETAINSLIDAGVNPADSRVSELTDKIFDLNLSLNDIKGQQDATTLFFKEVAASGSEAQKAFEDTKKAADDFLKTVQDMESTIDPSLLFGVDPNDQYEKDIEDRQKQVEKTKSKYAEIANVAGGVADATYAWSKALEGTNDDLAYALGTISEIAGGIQNIAQSAAKGDLVGTITATVGFGAQLFSIGKKVKQMNAEARAEVQKFYDEAVKGEMEYQALLRQRDRDTVARGKNSYQAIISQLDALKKQAPEVQKAYDDIYNSLQGSEYISGMGYEHGTWFRKAKTWDIMASLAGSDYQELEKLYTEGKLKDTAKTDFEALKKLKEELESVGVSIEDLQKQLGELLTGTSTSSLADGLTDLFENGKLAAQDLGQSFEEIMKNAISNTFRYKYLEDQMQPFYEALAKMMEGNTPTKEQIDALQDMYEGIGGKAADYWKQLEQITGQDLSGKNEASSLTSDTIKASLSEDTASKALGIWYGMWDMSKQQAAFLEQINASDRAIEAYTLQSIGLLTRIANSNDSIDIKMNKLDDVVSQLTTIARNTNQGTTSRDLGR